jgi:sugar lactone lactonase YvrE
MATPEKVLRNHFYLEFDESSNSDIRKIKMYLLKKLELPIHESLFITIGIALWGLLRSKRATTYGLVFVIQLSLMGCSQPKGMIFEPLVTPISWPPPPETARIHYVGSLHTDKDLKPAKSFISGVTESLFGENPSRSMLTPYSVCGDGENRIFVCDSNAQLVHVFNLETRKYEQWKPDSTNEAFSQPVGIAYDPDGRLLVSDSASGVIHVFLNDGEYLGTLGDTSLDKPSGIAIDPIRNRILVADVETHQIVSISMIDGELNERIGERGTSLGQFNFPTNIAIGHDGLIYVSDSLNFRVQVFSPDFKPLRQVGEKGDMPGYFSHPKGIAVDKDNRLFVIDSHFESVQIFDSVGKLLLFFGEEGHNPGQFWLPTGIHIDHSGRIWIADSYNQRLQVFEYRPEEHR